MSEFKFACPVCGQHLTVASSSSGQQMDCPTCFRRIVIPQAPASGDSKLLLAGAQPAQPRPTTVAADLKPLKDPRSHASLLSTVLLVALLGAAGAILYHFRAPLLEALGLRKQPLAQTTAPATNAAPAVATWTLEPGKAVIPERPISGKLHGNEFACEKVLFAGGTLSLRQGPGWPPELGLDILLSAQKAEQLNGKNIVITPGARSVVSKIVLRWKDDLNHAQSRDFTNGYALTLTVPQADAHRLLGRLYVALPDAEKTFAAGNFEAEVVQPRKNGK